MKINSGPAIWATALAVVVIMFGAPTLAFAYQSQQGWEHAEGHDQNKNNNDYTNNPYYQRGMSNGQDDASNNRVRQYRKQSENDNDNDRLAYEAGYDQGYQNAYRRDSNDRGNDRQNGYAQNQNPGYEMGTRDGSTDGRNDRSAGRAMNYGAKHPDRGYQSNYGDKQAYEQQYRQAYQQAYQQSYNGRAYDDRENNRPDDRGAYNNDGYGGYGNYGSPRGGPPAYYSGSFSDGHSNCSSGQGSGQIYCQSGGAFQHANPIKVNSACTQNRTWGVSQYGLWVSNGCAGQWEIKR